MSEDEAKELIAWHGMNADAVIAAYRRGVEEEREACANACEALVVYDLGNIGDMAQDCADAIRARSLIPEQADEVSCGTKKNCKA